MCYYFIDFNDFNNSTVMYGILYTEYLVDNWIFKDLRIPCKIYRLTLSIMNIHARLHPL